MNNTTNCSFDRTNIESIKLYVNVIESLKLFNGAIDSSHSLNICFDLLLIGRQVLSTVCSAITCRLFDLIPLSDYFHQGTVSMSDQMDLLVEQVKLLAGEIAFSTSTLKRLVEQSVDDPESSKTQVYAYSLC